LRIAGGMARAERAREIRHAKTGGSFSWSFRKYPNGAVMISPTQSTAPWRQRGTHAARRPEERRKRGGKKKKKKKKN
jgi:hypothetical protein